MTRLVVLDPVRFLPAGIEPIDIDTDFKDADVISVALPAFPLASVTQTSSFIYFTSHPEGDFDTGPTDSVAFNQSTVSLISGDSELRFPRSLLTTIDKKKVTGIRFKIQATGSCTVKVASVRLLSTDWVYSPIDMDTLWNRLERPVSLTATAATASAFPVGTTAPTGNVARGGSFETAADLARYGGIRASLALNTSEHTDGISSVRVTMTSANTSTQGQLTGDPDINADESATTNIIGAPILYNHTYTAKAKVKGPVGRNVTIGFRAWTKDGVLTAQPAGSVVVMDGTWKVVSYTVDLKGLSSTYARAGVTVNMFGANAEQFYVDELDLSYAPADWPVIYKADIPAGSADPMPVDVSATVLFQAGSLTNTVPGTSEADLGKQNEVALYFREQPADYFTQLDLDGSFTQATLNALGHQPEYGVASYTGRTQGSLDTYTQGQLDFFTQFDTERIIDTTASVWLKVHLKWDSSGASLAIRDSEDKGYTFPDLELAAHLFYILWVDLEEDSIRVRIYEVNNLGDIAWDSLVFDTGTMIDKTLMVRRSGRFGWWARFQDGDAYIANIRPRGVNYAEYRSAPFESFTPVIGANLVVGGTVDKELYDGVSPSPWGGRLDIDPNKSSSGKAIKVTNVTNSPLQGLMTNELRFDDFEEMTIDLKVWFPKTALDVGAKLEVFLLGENVRLVPLHIPNLKTDQWHKLRFYLTEGRKIQTGTYRLVLIQTVANVPTIWWVDEISIRTRVTSWAGRAHQGGAWAMEHGDWVPFRDTVNKANDGILFADRANRMQLRGQARRQDARISEIKATPKYAELGRFIWDEDRVTYSAPTANIASITPSGLTVTCNATQSGSITIYQWDFSDGTRAFGPSVQHTFLVAGTYDMTLTVVSVHGTSNLVTQTVTV